MKAKDFKSHEGKALKVRTEDGRDVELNLDKIEELEAKGSEDEDDVRSEPFALILSGSEQEKIMDQLVEVQLGKDEDSKDHLFLKPINHKGDKIIYEIIIN